MARPQKALVVDDLPLNRLILGTILHKLGFEVLEAENGLQCIDVYNQERTDLVCVFLDLQMPVADGWAATRGIRELESRTLGSKQTRVPVVVCTASCLDDLEENGQTVAQRALSLGADGAVRKPLTAFAVQRILDEHAPRWRCCPDELDDPSMAAPLVPPVSPAPLPPYCHVEPPSAAATTATGHGCSPACAAAGWACGEVKVVAPASGPAQPHPCRPHRLSLSLSQHQHQVGHHDHPPSPPQQQEQQSAPCSSCQAGPRRSAGGGGTHSGGGSQRQCGAARAPPAAVAQAPSGPGGTGATATCCEVGSAHAGRAPGGAVHFGRDLLLVEQDRVAAEAGCGLLPPLKRPLACCAE